MTTPRRASGSPTDLQRTAPVRPPQLFVSYAHADEAHKNDLLKHLSPLLRNKVVQIWHERDVAHGDVQRQVESALSASDLIVILLSPDYFVSDRLHDAELLRALAMADAGDAIVIPILVRPIALDGLPHLARLKALPSDGKAIALSRSRDDAWRDVVNDLRAIIERLSDGPAPSVRPTTREVLASAQTAASAPAEAELEILRIRHRTLLAIMGIIFLGLVAAYIFRNVRIVLFIQAFAAGSILMWASWKLIRLSAILPVKKTGLQIAAAVTLGGVALSIGLPKPNFVLAGAALDAGTKAPIAQATLRLQGTSCSATTDSNGVFELPCLLASDSSTPEVEILPPDQKPCDQIAVRIDTAIGAPPAGAQGTGVRFAIIVSTTPPCRITVAPQ